MKAVESVPATSILEIGPGFGKFGVLLRERFDIRHNRYSRSKWKTTIDCIEIWSPYITKLHNHVYSNIFIGNALNVLDKLNNYDIVTFIDGLEHLDKEEGIELLNKMYRKTNNLLILSFPRTLRPKANHEWTNPYEAHRSLWTVLDLIDILGEVTTHSPTVFSKRK